MNTIQLIVTMEIAIFYNAPIKRQVGNTIVVVRRQNRFVIAWCKCDWCRVQIGDWKSIYFLTGINSGNENEQANLHKKKIE